MFFGTWGRMLVDLLFFLVLVLGMSCAPTKVSYFGEEGWFGIGPENREIQLNGLPYETIVLNVYSPDCLPCVKEIPTLNYMEREWFQNNSRAKLFLVVDPLQILPSGEEASTWEKAWSLAKLRMEEDRSKNQILPEVLFLKPPFRVAPEALVTGTPETLILENHPLRLKYNFIGAISEEVDPKNIAKDNKVQFLKQEIGLEKL